MEDKKETTEKVSLPSDHDATVTTETATTTAPPPPPPQPTAAEAEPAPAPAAATEQSAPAPSEKKEEDASAKMTDDPSVSETVSAENSFSDAQSLAADAAAPATQPSETKPRSSSRRNSGVSGIAHRVHRHETRSPAEVKLPSRFSDYEVGSPRQNQSSRVSRQRSNDSLKKSSSSKDLKTSKDSVTTTTTTEDSSATVTKEDNTKMTEPNPVVPASVSAPAPAPAPVLPVVDKEVDPADALEMMLMSRGAIPAEPPTKKPREEKSSSETSATTESTAATTAAAGAPASAPAPAAAAAAATTTTPPKKSKSRRKTLVEGREARVVKPKFSLEQEMSLSDELQNCLALLNRMFRQDEYSPFYVAVDPVRLGIPDYWDVIKQPMDMTKIKEKLLSGKYADAKQFTQDVHLMFENARTYNPVGNPVHMLAVNLEKSFEEQMSKIHTRRAPSSNTVSPSNSSSSLQQSASKSVSRQNSSSSKKSRPSQSHVSSDSSSSSDDSSSSSSSGDSADEHRRRKQKHHQKHHHHHHRHSKKGDKSRGKKRSRSSSVSEQVAYEELKRNAELEKLQKEIQLLRNQLIEQKQSKAKAASAARAEKAAAKRVSKSTAKRSPVSFYTAPDPDRPVTEEDKRRISGNINRLPPERMLPLVNFVQDQIPPLHLVVPGCPPVDASEIEVDLDTLDNRTLRTVDHKVRQALALAGQARRRAERRLLEQQMQKELQMRHHTSIPSINNSVWSRLNHGTILC